MKQCGKCKYPKSTPTKKCACYTKVKLGDELVPMKRNANGFPYCSGFIEVKQYGV